MGIKVAGANLPWWLGGLKLDVTPTERAIARQVIDFLEDRRVLFGNRHAEDEWHCVLSAMQIREFLGSKIAEAAAGKPLSQTLKAMQGACRKFLDAAGPDASHFQHHRGWGADPFSLALGDFRTLMGTQIAVLAGYYDLEIADELAAILPPSY